VAKSACIGKVERTTYALQCDLHQFGAIDLQHVHAAKQQACIVRSLAPPEAGRLTYIKARQSAH
jgi:hypothetical protein